MKSKSEADQNSDKNFADVKEEEINLEEDLME